MSEIAELEARVNERWGDQQWDWTIGKCPEGWFFYCGTASDQRTGGSRFAHKGYALTLTDVLHAMLDVE